MTRLGELLVAAHLLTQEQVDQALRAQVVWGGRLGTNLVELKYIDLDGLSRALGQQHGLPAALGRHFDRADPVLQQRLPAELAERWSLVPLVRVGPEPRIVVAGIEPLDPEILRSLAEVFDVGPAQIIVSVAAELRVRYHLERVYHIQRGSRFLRAKGETTPPFPALAEVPVPVEAELTPRPQETPPPRPQPQPVRAREADDLAAQLDAAIATTDARTAEDAADADDAGRSRRTYIKTLGDMVDAGETRPLGRIAIRRVALPPSTPIPIVAEEPCADSGPATFQDAIRAIRRGADRDKVAELVVHTLAGFVPACHAAILLVVRGEIAISWKSFCRTGETPRELAVPLDKSGLVPCAVEHNATTRRAADELGAIDRLLLLALGRSDGDLAIVPVPIAGQAMCLIASATEHAAEIAELEAIATAAGVAFARLIRDASR